MMCPSIFPYLSNFCGTLHEYRCVFQILHIYLFPGSNPKGLEIWIKPSENLSTYVPIKSDFAIATTWSWSKLLEFMYPNEHRTGSGVGSMSYIKFNKSKTSRRYWCNFGHLRFLWKKKKLWTSPEQMHKRATTNHFTVEVFSGILQFPSIKDTRWISIDYPSVWHSAVTTFFSHWEVYFAKTSKVRKTLESKHYLY